MTPLHRPLLGLALALGLASAVTAQVRITDAWIVAPAARQAAPQTLPIVIKLQATQDKVSLTYVEPASAPGLVRLDNGKGGSIEGGISLPHSRTVELKPGGPHVVLTNVNAALTPGDKLRLIAGFDVAGQSQFQEFEVPVLAADPGQSRR